MIDFSNIKTQKTQTEFYLPIGLLRPMVRAMAEAKIPYKAYDYDRVIARDIPHPEITDDELEQKLKKFTDNDYEEAAFGFSAALIIAPVDKNTMFEMSKQFFGPTADPDFIKAEQANMQDGDEMYEEFLDEKAAIERLNQKYPGYI